MNKNLHDLIDMIVLNLALFLHCYTEPALAIPALNHGIEPQGHKTNQSSLKELFDGFLWAVPKHRRSKERNRMRRRSWEKRISFNTTLVPCEACGNLRQTGYLCGWVWFISSMNCLWNLIERLAVILGKVNVQSSWVFGIIDHVPASKLKQIKHWAAKLWKTKYLLKNDWL